jgi:hypothetical protein
MLQSNVIENPSLESNFLQLPYAEQVRILGALIDTRDLGHELRRLEYKLRKIQGTVSEESLPRNFSPLFSNLGMYWFQGSREVLFPDIEVIGYKDLSLTAQGEIIPVNTESLETYDTLVYVEQLGDIATKQIRKIEECCIDN